MIITHKLKLSDEATIEQIRENPYLQNFVEYDFFRDEEPFVPSLFVESRRRMTAEIFTR